MRGEGATDAEALLISATAGTRLRTLLILLALDANRTVSADRLIDGVWGDDPPATAGNGSRGTALA